MTVDLEPLPQLVHTVKGSGASGVLFSGSIAVFTGLTQGCTPIGANVFGRPGREMDLIRETLGDFAIIGSFANGEISNNRLYSDTGVSSLS